jgi:hypothetical protein
MQSTFNHTANNMNRIYVWKWVVMEQIEGIRK